MTPAASHSNTSPADSHINYALNSVGCFLYACLQIHSFINIDVLKVHISNLLLAFIRHLYLSAMCFVVVPTTYIKKTCVQMRLDYLCSTFDNQSRLNINVVEERGGVFNEHKNLHFDNEYDVHMSFKGYEKCGSDLNLDLQTISY